MQYRKFLFYNVIGGFAWVGLLAYAGYLFGNIPWVKNNLAWIVVGIVVVSLLPMVFQWLRERRERKPRTANSDR
jgi:membrane-associated protein